jgi:aminoglycoside phosphotransferase (APT) family kinase protein
MITIELAKKLIDHQFPEYAGLPITSVEKQGHDNRTYRLGDDLLIRMPTAEAYSLKVPKENALLPKLGAHISINIPIPIKMGEPSTDFPYPFSIYKWLDGQSANLVHIDEDELDFIAVQLALFLKELHNIEGVDGPKPGQHNWWRGDHVSVYDKGARKQIDFLKGPIDHSACLHLWEQACDSRWTKDPVWIHGDFSSGNILMKNNKLSGVIDFGGMGIGDPACDLVIAWTFLKENAREIFKQAMGLDADTWIRAKGWALWKATFELCHIKDRDSAPAMLQKNIISSLINKDVRNYE